MLWRFSALGKSILPVWCPATIWWEVTLAVRILRVMEIPYICILTGRAEKRPDSLILLTWEKYMLIVLRRGSCTTKKLYQCQYTGNSSTCQLLHASVNTLAGMGSIWMNANTTWQTVPLLYSCSLPHAPGIYQCCYPILMVFLLPPCHFTFLLFHAAVWHQTEM